MATQEGSTARGQGPGPGTRDRRRGTGPGTRGQGPLGPPRGPSVAILAQGLLGLGRSRLSSNRPQVGIAYLSLRNRWS